MTETNARASDYQPDAVLEHYWPTATRWTWSDSTWTGPGHERSAEMTHVVGFPFTLRLFPGRTCLGNVEEVTDARRIISRQAGGVAVVAPDGTVLYDPHAQHLAHARYLGADVAMAAATWVEMSASDARSILDDVDPAVLDRYPSPALTDDLADQGSTVALAVDVTGHLAWHDVHDALAEAWEDGRDDVWHDALQAHALRMLGIVGTACEVERGLEARVAGMRRMAGLS